MNVRFKRLLAAVIDFYIICFLSSGLIGIITLGEFNVTYFSVLLYLVTCFLLFLFKDYAFKNKSIGKRVFKLKVAKIDGTKLTFIDILKRSVPVIFLLPVEVLLLIINNRRIGDIWAKTTILRDCNLDKTDDGKTGDGSVS